MRLLAYLGGDPEGNAVPEGLLTGKRLVLNDDILVTLLSNLLDDLVLINRERDATAVQERGLVLLRDLMTNTGERSGLATALAIDLEDSEGLEEMRGVGLLETDRGDLGDRREGPLLGTDLGFARVDDTNGTEALTDLEADAASLGLIVRKAKRDSGLLAQGEAAGLGASTVLSAHGGDNLEEAEGGEGDGEGSHFGKMGIDRTGRRRMGGEEKGGEEVVDRKEWDEGWGRVFMRRGSRQDWEGLCLGVRGFCVLWVRGRLYVMRW